MCFEPTVATELQTSASPERHDVIAVRCADASPAGDAALRHPSPPPLQAAVQKYCYAIKS